LLAEPARRLLRWHRQQRWQLEAFFEGVVAARPEPAALGPVAQAEPLRVIRGSVPSPRDWPEGCRFRPRCDYAFEKCFELPPLLPVPPQESACWLCEQGRRATAVPTPPTTAVEA